jgi:hypothetical protein
MSIGLDYFEKQNQKRLYILIITFKIVKFPYSPLQIDWEKPIYFYIIHYT